MRYLLSLLLAFPLAAQTLETEVWLGALERRDGMLVITDLRNISQEPGYDNQPAFYADGKTLLFASQSAETLDETGMGVHAVRYDPATRTKTPLPEAKGFSPTPVGDDQLMVLRHGRVFLHDATGKEIRAVTKTDTAGYYTAFDETTWVLFMNEPERRIAIYDPQTNEQETMATGAISAPFRIPGEHAVTFVAEAPFPATEGVKGENVLYRLDLTTRKVEALATIPFETGGTHVWTDRGTMLMASGPVIREWSPAAPSEWKEVYRATHPALQALTRIAISPDGSAIALVSAAARETRRKD